MKRIRGALSRVSSRESVERTSSRSTSSLDVTQYSNKPGDAPLHDREYYHGRLPRDDIEALLSKPGDFLVRKTDVADGRTAFVVSVCSPSKEALHLVIEMNSRQLFQLGDRSFETITDAVDFYHATGRPLSSAGDVTLRHPLPRQKWELAHDDITIGDKLGEGEYGDVFKGLLLLDRKRYAAVAVKRMRGLLPSKQLREQFAREARVMRRFRHPNIIRLYGIAAQDDPLLIVMELAPGGSLLRRLQHGPPASEHTRIRYCMEAARGLRYLEKQSFVHRDVAARNCLLSGQDLLKMSDFGLGLRSLEEGSREQRLPIRWLAPESLRTAAFSNKSDVFGFGVLVWEVFADGAEPYPQWSTGEVREAVTQRNYRMPPLPNMMPKVALLLDACWADDPAKRPTFLHIKKNLKRRLAKAAP